MSRDLGLERRYRRVLRLLPGWYREQWEEGMVAAFLDGWLTGDPEADEYISTAARPEWTEVASVAGLAARLYLGGAGAPRRYFAWGQAIRRAVLTVLLMHATLALDVLVRTAWNRRLFGLPAPPASLMTAAPGGAWPMVFSVVNAAWIVIFVALVLGHYRAARILAALAIVPGLAAVLQAQLTGSMPAPSGPWARPPPAPSPQPPPFPPSASPATPGSSSATRHRPRPGSLTSPCPAGIKPSSFSACWPRPAEAADTVVYLGGPVDPRSPRRRRAIYLHDPPPAITRPDPGSR